MSLVKNLLRMQFTNIVKEAIVQGINDYINRSSEYHGKDYIYDISQLTDCILSSLGMKIEVLFTLIKEGMVNGNERS
jgi:hypothetical protein